MEIIWIIYNYFFLTKKSLSISKGHDVTTEKTVTKDQHFVPQFYLKNFLNDKNQIEVLDCYRGKLANPKGTKGICKDPFFYALETGEYDKASQDIESYFKGMEDQLSKALPLLINKIIDNSQLDEADKYVIALLMSMIWIRGPKFRKFIKNSQKEMLKGTMRIISGHPIFDKMIDEHDSKKETSTSKKRRQEMKDILETGEFNIQVNNAMHLRAFKSLEKYANLFWGQYWTIYISKSCKKFITSDSPVAVVEPEKSGFYGTTFLERTHYFSLTPEICIMATSPKKSRKKLKRKTIYDQEADLILRTNIIFANRSDKYAYSKNKQDLYDLINTREPINTNYQ